MVIGNGTVANSFTHYANNSKVLIFASGVSNSKSNNESDFRREETLIKESIKEYQDYRFVYFSTFNIYDNSEKDSPYCLHKLKMEKIITDNVYNYHIFRLGHVAASASKKHTVLSFLVDAITSGEKFNVWQNAARNIIDIDDISKICTYIIDNEMYTNNTLDICNTSNIKIPNLVGLIEDISGIKGIYTNLDCGEEPVLRDNPLEPIFEDLNIHFDAGYVRRVITKYYFN